ncbi:hypothetical protein SDC9_76210 [bioreactor metagenome]|uniref:Uncharacterized protein n=1 Tax=bioreactor metagenome TaxID=1076179 RepID=A0A644YML5_9ZZZZ
MKEYIIISGEGYTQSPSSQDVENQQVLGYEFGADENDARESFFKRNDWQIRAGFLRQNAFAYQIIRN